jgi:uncharacterized protein
MNASGADRLIAHAGRALLDAASSPARVILFGPHAREESDDGSPLDFLVVEQDLDDQESETKRLHDALASLKAPVNVIVMSATHVEQRAKLAGSMVERVLREGRVIAES